METGPSDSALPPEAYLWIGALMALLGGVGLLRLVLYGHGADAGVGLVCLGAACAAFATGPAIRRSRRP